MLSTYGRLTFSSLYRPLSGLTTMSSRLVAVAPARYSTKSDDGSSDADARSSSSSSSGSVSPIPVTEPLPPIPPNYGYRGDENIKSMFEIKKIRKSFRYGNPPQMRRHLDNGPLVIRILPLTHCTNRPFFRLALTRDLASLQEGYIEDLGSIDPMPNKDNQILCALNLTRIRQLLARGVQMRGFVAHYLGLAGFLPVSPRAYLIAFKNRKTLEQRKKQEQDQNAAAESANDEQAASQA